MTSKRVAETMKRGNCFVYLSANLANQKEEEQMLSLLRPIVDTCD
jgi:hypothetical protein